MRAAAVIALLSCSTVVRADAWTFDDRAAFDAAAPGLPVEDFNSDLVLETIPGLPGFADIDGPIDATSDNAAFEPGDILVGLTVDVTGDAIPPAGFGSIAVVGPALFPSLTSRFVGPNFAFDGLVLDFAPGVHAVAFDFTTDELQPGSGTRVSIDVFSGADLLVAVTLPNPEFFSTGEAPSGFFGVLADRNITSIRVVDPDDGFEFLSNVAFGDPVPEPGAALLVGAALGFGLWRRWRRRA